MIEVGIFILLLSLDQSIRRNESNLATQLVHYWKNTIANIVGHGNITLGSNYLINGTGHVNWQDTDKIEAVKYALSYLAKNDKNTANKTFKNAEGKNVKSFFVSQYNPKEENRGRPRSIK